MRYMSDRKYDKTLAAHINCPTCGDIIFVWISHSHSTKTKNATTNKKTKQTLNRKITFASGALILTRMHARTMYTRHTSTGVDDNLLDVVALKIPANHSFAWYERNTELKRPKWNYVSLLIWRATICVHANHPKTVVRSLSLTDTLARLLPFALMDVTLLRLNLSVLLQQ